MGDMAEIFNDMREFKKQRRKSNLERSTELLIEKGVEFESKNNGVHLIVKGNDVTFDFYPSTGLFINRASKKQGRGVFNLLKKIGVEKCVE